MTIPTRPAPPPPQQNIEQQNGGVNSNIQSYGKITITLPPPPSAKNKTRQQISPSNSSVSHFDKNEINNSSISLNFPQSKTRYEENHKWTDTLNNKETNVSSFKFKKAPPPRPPPPKVPFNTLENRTSRLVKNNRPPQSVNILSNLFGRRKSPATNSQKPPHPKLQISNSQILNKNQSNQNSSGLSNTLFSDWTDNQFQQNSQSQNFGEVQLISFDSPPNSPTFTQKSNSDCVSVDSFSSDSNFSSPHNGSASQPESGFEDDFNSGHASTFSTKLTTPVDPWDILNESKSNNSINTARPNYMHLNDMKNIDGHPIRNLHILERKANEKCHVDINTNKNTVSTQQKLGMPTIIRPKFQKGAAPKPPKLETNLHNRKAQPTKQFKTLISNELDDSYEEDDPPMPSCPPPPPPPLALLRENESDTLESIDSNELAYGIALYDFEGNEDGDLNLKENDKIYLLRRLNDEWFMGKNKRGCEGIFPSNYVDIVVPLKEESRNYTSPVEEKVINNLYVEGYPKKCFKVKVLYNFEALQPGDLTILENEIVKVLYQINEDWLYGEVNNKQGQFPANYVEKIDDL